MSSTYADSVHAAALAALPGMTPVRLVRLLSGLRPTEAWDSLCRGTHAAEGSGAFRRLALNVDVRAVGDRYQRAGVAILLPGDEGYPGILVSDPGAPAVLFSRGDPGVLGDQRRVAIVGTRSATPYGRQVAAELGRDLALSGITVVSGLARGIDGAAHAGVLAAGDTSGGTVAPAPPVAVVGTGLDVPYPSSNARLWDEVGARGVLLSEAPLGAPPRPRSFPARNRIIAALSDVVVVVESHHGGGSLYTVEAAARRAIPVCAVPGSVRSRASDGTNALLVDGCIPVRDAADVLVAVSLARRGIDAPAPLPRTSTLVAAHPRRKGNRPFGRGPGSHVLPGPRTTAEHQALAAIDDTPTALETVLLRSGLDIAAAIEACAGLAALGLVTAGPDWWSRR